MPKKRTAFSRRAPLLRFVVDCINSNQYEDQGGYMIFGTERDTIIENGDYEPSQDIVALREVISDFKAHHGREHAKGRTSLGKQPSLTLRGMERLSAESVQRLADAVRKAPVSSGPPSEAKLMV